jgi:hypothetical protein
MERMVWYLTDETIDEGHLPIALAHQRGRASGPGLCSQRGPAWMLAGAGDGVGSLSLAAPVCGGGNGLILRCIAVRF